MSSNPPTATRGRRAGRHPQSPATETPTAQPSGGTSPTTNRNPQQQQSHNDSFPQQSTSSARGGIAPPFTSSSGAATPSADPNTNPFGFPAATSGNNAGSMTGGLATPSTSIAANQPGINASSASVQPSTTTNITGAGGIAGLPDFLQPSIPRGGGGSGSNLFSTPAAAAGIHQEGREPPSQSQQQQNFAGQPSHHQQTGILFGGEASSSSAQGTHEDQHHQNTGENQATATGNTTTIVPSMAMFLPSTSTGPGTNTITGEQGPSASSASASMLINANRRNVQMVDASVETASLLTIDQEISLAAKEARELDQKILAATTHCTELESKLLLSEDEFRIKELSSQRDADSAQVELERIRTSGVEYMERKLRELDEANVAESKKMYEETKGFSDQRKQRELQRLQEEKAKLETDVTNLTEKRDLLEAENDGVNETAIARKIRKAKTVDDKIQTATDISHALASQLKKYIVQNVQDIVRVETGQAFVDIRRDTVQRRSQERTDRSTKLSQFQSEAVRRSEELMNARDEARKKRTEEHQKLLKEARERATKSTTQSTQALLDQVRTSHEETMRKFENEFESQHQHLKQMHKSIVKDDGQLDDQKKREIRQRFESHRKMAKELLDADVSALIQTKEREAKMLAEAANNTSSTTDEGGPISFATIQSAVSSAVNRGSADIQRRISTLNSNVQSETITLEKQTASKLAALDQERQQQKQQQQSGNSRHLFSNQEIEKLAVTNELKKALANSTDKRIESQKSLELCVDAFVQSVDKCSSITNVQRNEVRALASQSTNAQTQWDAELRRMMADFSIIAALNNQHKNSSSSSTPVGFLLSSLNDSLERLSAQVNHVKESVMAPVVGQKRLLAEAVKEDSERVAAHNAINAKVMKIFQMFEVAEATMDSIRQREDEVRVEEISLETQQRQLAEDRRQFSVKCAKLRNSLEQTEKETNAAQIQEREARQQLADSERQLGSLAIEQRTMLAKAGHTYQQQQQQQNFINPNDLHGNDYQQYAYQAAMRANVFIDPMAHHVDKNNTNSSVHHTQMKTASSYIPTTNINKAPLGDATNRQQSSNSEASSRSATTTSQQQQQNVLDDSGESLSADERLKKMKAKLMSSKQIQQQQKSSSSASQIQNTTTTVSEGGYENSTIGEDDESIPRNRNSTTKRGGTTTQQQHHQGVVDSTYNTSSDYYAEEHHNHRQNYNNTNRTAQALTGRHVRFNDEHDDGLDIAGLPVSNNVGAMSSMAAAYSPPRGNTATSVTSTSSGGGARSS